MGRNVYHGYFITTEKTLARTAYPRNGNVHNPTKYYNWSSFVNGKIVTSMQSTRRAAIEVAQEFIDSGEVEG